MSSPCYRVYVDRYGLAFLGSVGPGVLQFFQSTENLVFIPPKCFMTDQVDE